MASTARRTALGMTMARLTLACLILLWPAAGWVPEARADTEPPLSAAPESQVKAAFLYNFLKFVDSPQWKDGPVVIGVVGNAAFADIVEDTVRGKTVNGRPVGVSRFAKWSDVRGCQEVFVSAPAPASVGVLPGVLTVGEEPRFLRAGGILNFYLEDNKVRFEISTEGAKASGLHVSAQLLKLGRAR